MSRSNNLDDNIDHERDLRIPAALVRTAFSSEQTLMSWIRTSLSLIAFGFSITQFFQYMGERQKIALPSAAPRLLGITLVSTGILVLALAAFEHILRIRRLKDEGLPEDSRSFLPIAAALAMLLIGITALAGILTNWSI